MNAEEIILYTSIAVGVAGTLVGLLTLHYTRYKGIGTMLMLTETGLQGAGLYFAVLLVINSSSQFVWKWAFLVPIGTALLISVGYILVSFSERYARNLAGFKTSWYATGAFIFIIGGAFLAEKVGNEVFLLVFSGATFNVALYLLLKLVLRGFCCGWKVEEHILKAVSVDIMYQNEWH